MILVMGGYASGKRSYVRTLGYTDDEMSERLTSACPVLLALEDLVREGPLTEEDLEACLAKEVVVTLEMGQGIVPLDREVRAWRERVGRTQAMLAGHAEAVVRMVCGVPQHIKGGK